MNDLINRADAISVLEIFTQTDTLGHTPKQIVEALPPAQPEVTEEAVKEYCHKRNLCIVDSALLKKYASTYPERKRGRCVWCSSPFRIEYYWIDREGNTASFQDEECHVVATGIANFCPNCGADMRGENDGNRFNNT